MPDSGRLFPAILIGLALIMASCATSAKDASDMQSSSVTSTMSFYQKYISSVDGDRCSMVPSCSSYFTHAVKKHGLFLGWIMTCDRLMRCGRDEFRVSEIRLRGQRQYCLDSVENNDFWWYETSSPEQGTCKP